MHSVDAALAACGMSGWTIEARMAKAAVWLAHLSSVGEGGPPLCREPFLATDFGPTTASLLKWAARECTGRVRDPRIPFLGIAFLRGADIPPLDPGTDELLRRTLEGLRGVSPGGLVALTHRPGGAWNRHYVPGANLPIAPSSIVAEHVSMRDGRAAPAKAAPAAG